MQNSSLLGCDDGVSAPVHWTGERLDSWKEVASYFRREVRTVQLWEKTEGLPVRRQVHQKRGSVYAYRRELEAWWIARSAISSRCRLASESTWSGRAANAQERASEVPRILVLPFAMIQSAPERGSLRQTIKRFGEGLRKDLVTELRRLRIQLIFLPVKAVPSPGTWTLGFLENMAKQFSASFLVTGNIRYSGTQASVSVQLIRGEDSTCAWSERYEVTYRDLLERDSGLAVRISQAIAQESVPRVKVRKQDTGTSQPPAYHACQMGFYFWRQRSKEALIKALGYFEDAIALDPNCADAYAGLADTYISLSYNYLLPSQPAASLAGDAVEKALRLDKKSLQVQNSLINVLINCTWDWASAERASLQLIDSGKMDIRTLQLYSTLMNAQGRHDEAISLALHGHRLEPLSDLANGQVAVAYFYAGDYSNALSFVRHTIEVQPHFAMGHALLGRTEIERGNWDQAIHALNRGLALSNRSPCILALLACAYGAAGDVPRADTMLLELEEGRPQGCFPAYDVSAVHAILHRDREAMLYMSMAYDARDMKTIYASQDPRFARLRSAHQFRQIVSAISAA